MGSTLFRLLGPLEFWRDGERHALPPRNQRWMLAVLLLAGGEPVPENRLADFVWGPAGTTPGALHTTVSRLRSWLGAIGCTVEHSGGSYRLIAPSLRVDAHEFRELMREATGRPDAEQIDILLKALELWRDVPLAGAPDWLRASPLVTKLEASRRDCALRLGVLAAATGRPEVAVASLSGIVAAYPLDEPLHATYLQALAAAGRPADALVHFDEFRKRLGEELGVDPSDAVQRVYLSLLSTDQRLDSAIDAVTRAPAQLPAAVRGFTGRADELAWLDTVAATTGSGMVVAVVSGTAGVGKTALVVHWAHRIADRYPDGQLYLNLRGFDPTGPPVAPAEGIRVLLEALGRPPDQIPASIEARAGLYRSLLAGRRMLIVLDNARDAEQVRPLLPGSPACLVAVTSRYRLGGLVAVEGAHPIKLDLLSAAESHQLLVSRLGEERVQREVAASQDIVERCARLPLALAIVAARAATQPRVRLADLAAQLGRRDDTLEPFVDEDLDLRAVFAMSYQRLRPPTRRLFCLLGLHPGPDTSVPAVASLAAIPPGEARHYLAELINANLVTEPAPGRYWLHDLLRRYATETAHADAAADERHEAIHRLLDHYLHSAHRAAVLLEPVRQPIAPDSPLPGVIPEGPAGYEEAMAWCTVERPVLLAAAHLAATGGFDTHAWRLARTLADFLQRRGYWDDQLTVGQLAVQAAGRLDDRLGQAESHRGVARAFGRLQRYPESLPHLHRALELYRELGHDAGQASIHMGLSWTANRQGDAPTALDQAEQALEIYLLTGDRSGQATALNSIGWNQGLLGQHGQALDTCRRAVSIVRELNDRNLEAHTVNSLALQYRHMGDFPNALRSYQESLDLFRELGIPYEEASTLIAIGDVHAAAGDGDSATRSWHDGLRILEELGSPHVDEIRSRLLQGGQQ
ncbi:MAG TPA: tetratricopeptide repeat protein [Candidatus Limnocylindrales bacterium]